MRWRMLEAVLGILCALFPGLRAMRAEAEAEARGDIAVAQAAWIAQNAQAYVIGIDPARDDEQGNRAV
jgi:hypothetical protein